MNRIDLLQQIEAEAPLLKSLMMVFEPQGEARIVGGAVRDAMLKKPFQEIDLATNLPPEHVMANLKKAGIKVVPTGLQHGTVTAVLDHEGYEITTLRHDVETDGRHAKVVFTDDWQADAARRDFTINALYLNRRGELFDYFTGTQDLQMGVVRFIGCAEDRIREDVLRILRFYRFYAYFGKGDANREALDACQKLAPLINTLSMERVTREILKLLKAPNPVPAWRLMLDADILNSFLPYATQTERLSKLLELEKRFTYEPHPLIRLAALIPFERATAEKCAAQLKLSNHEKLFLLSLSNLPPQLRGKLEPVPFRRALYRHGEELAIAAAFLLAADGESTDLDGALATADLWESPIFPIKGDDLIAFGLKQGPELGNILRQIETWWIDLDFRATREEVLLEARRIANNAA